MDDEILEQIPSRTYHVSNGRITRQIDELEAMRQAVEKVLQTERFAWAIYTDNYGIELQNLIGEDHDLVLAEIERVITEALSVDERIIEVEDFSISQQSGNSLLVSFIVVTIFGQIKFEQEVKTE